MKRQTIQKIMALCLAAVAAAGFTACSDDEQYDVVGNSDNLAYFPTTAMRATTNTITVTPAGAMGVVGKYGVLFQRPVSDNTTVTVVADTALARQYNEDNGTDYAILPAGVVDYTYATATVEKGQAQSIDEVIVRLGSNALSQLTESRYLAAFRMSEVKGAGKASSNRNVFYSLVNTDVLSTLHVVSGDAVSYRVSSTPVGSFGNVSFVAPFSLTGELNNKATLTLTQDNSLLDDYNTAHRTTASAVPDGVMQVDCATVTIENGTSESVDSFRISIPESKLSLLTANQYVIPYRLTAQPDGGTATDCGVFYMVVNIDWKLVREDATLADLKGTMIPVATMADWTEAGGLAVSRIADDTRSTTWARGTHTIDMQQDYRVTGVKVMTRYANGSFTQGLKVELSTDGTSWTDAGTLTTMPRDEEDYQYFILYGGWTARYMRITYGTTTLSELRVYAE